MAMTNLMSEVLLEFHLLEERKLGTELNKNQNKNEKVTLSNQTHKILLYNDYFLKKNSHYFFV
ncbi:hypothetical protein EB1_26430 [Empedobacter brevis NBRC 14943 = ATCC 43319]|uniref:Uncharacterized protein n=1 Tax=Empedobacter brevis NBRC 14943 = ATCC 43319 TaxID=1218108 RepID=A0A511NJ93_9FLAO|nr:hypothetical protein EB1_26430 [Empedobacter brevis NBRC 14943 = ATCC 43319]